MRSISESEKLIMKVVWEANKDLATQELITILKEQYGKDYARTTVVTFVDRLKQKGYVTTQRIGKQSYIHAIISKEEYLPFMVKQIVDFWFDGKTENMIKQCK